MVPHFFLQIPARIHRKGPLVNHDTLARLYHAQMTINRRHQAAMSTNDPQSTPGRSTSERTALLGTSGQDKPRLLSYEDSLRLLPWQTDNEYVRSGYRSQLGSVKACLWSTVACAYAMSSLP